VSVSPVLDCHHHVWDLSVRHQPWLDSDAALAPLRRNFSIDDLRPLAASAGVTATVLVQTVTEPGETSEMLAIAAADSLVAAVVGWVDLTAPDVADALAALAGLPGSGLLAGIRHPALIEPEPGWLARPDVRRGLAAVAAAGLTYDVVVRPEQLPAATQAAAALPGLMFVLDHFGNVEIEPRVDEQWKAAFEAFADLPNTVGKLSGILGVPGPAGPPPPAAGAAGQARIAGHDHGDGEGDGDGDGDGEDIGQGKDRWPDVRHLRPYYEIALASFGPERLMFGSDWPVSTLGSPYADVVGAARALISDLSRPEQDAILAGTARRVYRISPALHEPPK
jgi:L-fuconolactonase